MSGFIDLFRRLEQQIRQSPRQLPSAVTVALEQTDEAQEATDPFARDQHYFQVRVNQMFLMSQRKWFSAIDPAVLVVSDFIYDRKEVSVPFMVGPAMMQKYGEQTPHGMLFADTRVAGLHPYRGGRLSLSVVLCEVQVANYARELLQLIEGAARALDFATALSAYIKIAGVIFDGFETLVGLGGTVPLIGLRREFDPDGRIPFRPGFFALIDKPDVDPKSLWVRERQLLQGPSLGAAKPFRDADFVLYSVVRTPGNARSDVDLLPFTPLWDRVLDEARKPDDVSWRTAKANMAALRQALILSPDLTSAQADSLAGDYIAKMTAERERATDLSTMSGDSAMGFRVENKERAAVDAKLRSAADILDL